MSGTLADIAVRVKQAGLKAPAIIVVGEVVSLRERLKWFETRPLLGKRIVVTRARDQASELVKALCNLGAECLEIPTIRVAPPDDWGPLDRAVAELPSCDWIVFTSVNGVERFFERVFSAGKDARALGFDVFLVAIAQHEGLPGKSRKGMSSRGADSWSGAAASATDSRV